MGTQFNKTQLKNKSGLFFCCDMRYRDNCYTGDKLYMLTQLQRG